MIDNNVVEYIDNSKKNYIVKNYKDGKLRLETFFINNEKTKEVGYYYNKKSFEVNYRNNLLFGKGYHYFITLDDQNQVQAELNYFDNNNWIETHYHVSGKLYWSSYVRNKNTEGEYIKYNYK